VPTLSPFLKRRNLWAVRFHVSVTLVVVLSTTLRFCGVCGLPAA
jgi:hypothetical protein